MTIFVQKTFAVGQAVWLYMTFTNPDEATDQNPNGLVDADPVTVTYQDAEGAIVPAQVATHLSLGFYRFLVVFTVGGGNYLISANGSGLGTTSELVVIPVDRSPF